MELGGNSNAHKYYDANKLVANGMHDFTAPLSAKYRQDLLKQAEQTVAKKPGVIQKVDVIQPKEMKEEIVDKVDNSKIVAVKYACDQKRKASEQHKG